MKTHRHVRRVLRLVELGIVFGLAVASPSAGPDNEPPVIAALSPLPGDVAALTQITVTFSKPVGGVDADDLLLNGQPATSVTGADATYTFGFPQPAAGLVEVQWDGGHGIVDRATPPNSFEATRPDATWRYNLLDLVPPTVANLVPAAGATVRQLPQVEVTFSEAVIGVDAGDLRLDGRPASAVKGDGAGPYVFQFGDSGAGSAELAWNSAHGITDLASPANAFGGRSWSYLINPNPVEIVINEVLAANQNGLRDDDGEPQDWIELLNLGTNAVDLAGWSLTDERDRPGKWVFPSAVLSPGQFLVVFASGKDRRLLDSKRRLHTNFKLNASGEYLALFNAESPRLATTEFAPEFPWQRTDIAYGRASNSGTWGYFVIPTPGAANPPAQSFFGVVAAPIPSVKRGLFTQPFSLTLTSATPEAAIYYTLDGSEPTQTSGQRYVAPLNVEGLPGRAAVTVRAVAYRADYLRSAVTTCTYLFPERVLTQPATPPGFPADWVSSITTRGDYEMDPQVLGNTRYAALARQALTNLPAVSIVMNVDHLFGATRGVYTRRNDANQQPASAELIWPDGRKGFQIDCGLEIQGGSSTGNAGNDWKSKKLSMRLLFKGDFGPGKLEYPLYEDAVARRFDTLILDAGLNLTWNHMTDADQRNRAQYVRDQFMSDLQNSVGLVGPHGHFVHLYLNGLYWGLYDLHERPDDSFCAEHFGGTKEEYDVLKHTGTTLVCGTLSAWNTMMSAARTGLADNGRYEILQQHLDLPWFIDYMILNFWAGNSDWAHHNWYAARRRVPGAGFRFISWDAEHVLKSATENRLNANDRNSPTELFTLLRTNAEFRLLFADHVHRHFFNGATFHVDPQRSRWDPAHPERNVPASLYMKRIAEIDPAIVCESARWGDVATPRANQPYTRDVEWLTELNNLLGLTNTPGNTANYFPRRSFVVLDQFRAAGLYPPVAAPEFNQLGGWVARGFRLAMTAPEGTIYYTTNGTDPRLYGSGDLSPQALAYSGEVPLTETGVIKARVLARNTWSASTEATFQVGELGQPLRFTEIMYHPPGGDACEFLELGNVGRVPVDLTRMSLEGVDFMFPFGVVLAPGEVLVLSSAADPAAFAVRYPGVRVAGAFGGDLSNGGERLALKDRHGNTVTSVEYNDANGWPRAADGGGSLEALDASADATDPANWRASTSTFGSPGKYSAVPPSVGLRFNELMADNAGAVPNAGTFPDWIELLNTAESEVDASGYSLTDDGDQPRKFVIPGGTRIPSEGFLMIWCDTATNAPGLHAGFALDRSGECLFLFDPQTNVADAVSFGLQVANRSVGLADKAARTWELTLPTPGAANQPAPLGAVTNLVINEWLANATANGADWLELHNRDSKLPTALAGLYLATSNATFQIRSLSFVPPGGFVRLWADEKPGTAHVDFKLPAAGGRIELYDNSAQLIDRIEYAAQVEGVSYGRLPDDSTNLVQLPALTPGLPNTANPPAKDTDGDGLPDDWELAKGLDPNNPRDAALDTDGDGLTNAQEFVAGTDPRQAASALSLTAERDAAGIVVLRFPVVERKSYTLQYRESLTTGVWLRLRDLPAQSSSGQVVSPDPEANISTTRFYRLVTPQLPSP